MDGSNSEDEANALNKDGETQLKMVDDSTPSGSGTTKTLINTMLPGLVVTDSSGRRTGSKSPVGVLASLLCKVNSQYVRLKKMERIAKYVSKKKDTVHMNNLVAWSKDVEETYALYEKEHALTEEACPASFVTNPYFDADFHTSFYEQYHAILLDLSTLEQLWYT